MRTARWWWLLWLLSLVACAGAGSKASAKERLAPGLVVASDEAISGRSAPAAARPEVNAGAFYQDGGDGDRRARAEGRTATPGTAERLLIYRGEMRLEVASPEDAVARFLTAASEWGGYLQSQSGTMVTVRIPSARFEPAFTALRGYGRVLGETRAADDVTEEFTDLGLRIDNARKSLERLREILQKAEKVEEILKVEEQMRRLTEEIERMEGRRKLLADQVAMATLRAEFVAKSEPPPVKRQRQPSRFYWINAVGAERLVEDF